MDISTLVQMIDFEHFLDKFPSGIIVTNLDGEILLVNQPADQMFGYQREELVGKPVEILIPKRFTTHPQHREKFTANPHSRPMGKGLVLYGLRQDGSEFLVDISLSVVDSKRGKLVFVLVYDLTEREKLQETLYESEERFRKAFDYAPVGMALVSPEGRWLKVNHSFCELVGYSEEALLTLDFQSITHPDDLETALEHLHKILSGEITTFQLEKRYLHKNGSDVWVQLSVSWVSDAQGRPLHFIKHIQDITKRKQAEEALRKNEQRFRSLIENLVTGVLVHHKTKPLFVNPAYARMFGYQSPDEILVMDSVVPMIAPYEQARLLGYHAARVKGEEAPSLYDFDAVRKDASIVTFQQQVTTIPWEGQTAVLATLTDVTERRLVELEKEKLIHDMGERIKELGMISTVSTVIRENKPLEEVLQLVASSIPPAWHYPEITRGKVLYKEQRYVSAPFEESRWCQKTEIMVHRERVGFIEVYYLEERPEIDEGPFMKEERTLINNIGIMIGSYITRIQAEHALLNLNKELEQRVQQRTNELQKSEQRYRLLADNATDLIWTMDMVGNFTYVSPAITFLSGFTVEEFTRLQLSEVWTPASFEIAMTIYNEILIAVSAKKPFVLSSNLELEQLRKDGSAFWVDVVPSILYDTKRNAIGIMAVSRDITERKQMELALRESETRYRSVVEDQTEYISRWKPDGTLTFVNKRYAELFGKHPEELNNANLSQLMQKDNVEELKRNIQTLTPEHPTITQEFSGKTPAFLGRWFQGTDRGIFDEEGNLLEVQSIARDVTERKLYEQELLLKNAIVEAVANAVVLTDANGTILWVNPAFTTLTGYSLKEAVGQNPRILKSGYHDKAYYTALWDAIKAGRVWFGEFVNKRKDGTLYHEEMTITPVKNGAEEIIQFIAVKQDVTARKVAEEALMVQTAALQHAHSLTITLDKVAAKVQTTLIPEHFYKMLEDELSKIGIKFFVGLIASNHQGLVVQHVALGSMAKTEIEKLSGVSTQGYYIPRKKFPPYETVIEQGRSQFVKDISKLFEAVLPDFPVTIANSIARLTGISSEISILNIPLSSAGKNIGVIGLWGKDLHEDDIPTFSVFATQVANAIRISELFKQAQAASQAKTEFLSRMSHELRTPLNSILGFAQLLEFSQKDPLTNTQRERVAYIVQGGKYLLDLVNEVLDISRIETDRMQLSTEPIRIWASIHEACELTKPLAAQRDLHVETQDKPDSDVYILADQQRLKQVLLNLLSNAVKYNRQGGHVSIYSQRQGDDFLRIMVSDTGPGIPSEMQDKLFIPFERLWADGGEVDGTGLGLALSKQLVELMGGKIGVESVEGKGSTFWVEFPITGDPMRHLTKENASGSLSKSAKNNFKILYIEDNLVNIELIREVLSEYPHVELLSETRAESGIALASRARPDLILLDLHLPDIKGKEALLRLKSDEITRAIPIVILSADATPGSISELMKVGAETYLTKPPNVKEFIQLVNGMIENKGKDRIKGISNPSFNSRAELIDPE